MNKKLGGVIVAIGLVLIIAGVVLMAVIVPGMKVFPDDVDTTRTYDVEYLTMLNPDTMEFVTFENGAEAALHITRNVLVEEATADETLVRETQTLLVGDQIIREPIVKYHTLDRHTMEFLQNPPEAWTQHDGYWPRQGLVIGWGIGTEKKDYVGWNDDTRTTTQLVFVREEEHAGIDTYYFTSTVLPENAGRIADAHVAVLGLPTSLSIEQLQQLATNMEFDDPQTATLVQTFLPVMVRTAVQQTQEVAEGEEIAVPLEYYYDYRGEYWVEPTTGVLIDTRKYEHRAVTFPQEIIDALKNALAAMGRDPEGLTALLPVTINEFEYVGNPESVQEAVKDAKDAKDQLQLFGVTIPMALIAVGLLAILAGWYLFFVAPGRKPTTQSPG